MTTQQHAKFGQLAIGAPGSGKSTYCNRISLSLRSLDRKVCIINLDPANDSLPYAADIDISELITLDDIMSTQELGPNGSLIYAMEYLERNLDWLIGRLSEFSDHYFIFDFPGQVELFTHTPSVKNIITSLCSLDYRLVAVHLCDAHHCTDPGKYISMCMLTLKAMINLEISFVGVLSKVDLIEGYGKLTFGLDFYTQVQDLGYLLESLNEGSHERFWKLNGAIIDLIQDYNLVSFIPLCIDDPETVIELIRTVDRANGYINLQSSGDESVFKLVGKVGEWNDEYDRILQISEKYIKQEQDIEITERESTTLSEQEEQELLDIGGKLVK